MLICSWVYILPLPHMCKYAPNVDQQWIAHICMQKHIWIKVFYFRKHCNCNKESDDCYFSIS